MCESFVRETWIARKRATPRRAEESFEPYFVASLFFERTRGHSSMSRYERFALLTPSNDQRQGGFDGRDGDPRREEARSVFAGQNIRGNEKRRREEIGSLVHRPLFPFSLSFLVPSAPAFVLSHTNLVLDSSAL